MYKVIEIKDSENGSFLSVSLYELLKIIEPYVADIKWSIYELSSTGKSDSDLSLVNLEDEIDDRDTGIQISWSDLLELTSKLNDVINLILVGKTDDQDFTAYENTNSWRKQYPIIVEIVDGYAWNVYSSSEKLISLLENKFNDTSVKIN